MIPPMAMSGRDQARLWWRWLMRQLETRRTRLLRDRIDVLEHRADAVRRELQVMRRVRR